MYLPTLRIRPATANSPLGSAWFEPRPLALFNQWLQFGCPTLILRGPGLSICLETEFGVFFEQDSTRFPGPGWAEDPVSGLAIQPASICGIALLAGVGAPPSFEIAFGPDSAFSLAIQPRRDASSDRLIRRIAATFHARPAREDELRARGAGAWLDQWNPVPQGWTGTLSPAETDAGLDFSLHGPGLAFSTRLRNFTCDRDGDTCRLADQERRAVVYADRTRHSFLGHSGSLAGMTDPVRSHHSRPIRGSLQTVCR
jgi:hypothetical protein